VKVSRRVRAVLSGICWTLAVASAIFTAAAFAGGGVICQSGEHAACTPQTAQLAGGILLTLAFGVAGARLYTPPRRPEPRRPWEYRD
jgi:hypothetical protein